MSASENQAAEDTKGTDDRKMDPPRNIIRIRLPPRKRMSNDLMEKREALDDANNVRSNSAPEQTNNKIATMKLTIAAAQASSISTRERLCNEANNNTSRKTLPSEPNNTSSDKLPEEANDSIPSKNLTTTAGVWGSNVTNYFAKEDMCEEANNNVPSKALPVPIKQLPENPVERMPSKNPTTMQVLGEEENNNSLRLFDETGSEIPSKVEMPEQSKNNQNRNLIATAVKCEEANNDPLSRKWLEDANNDFPTRKLSNKAKNNPPNDKPIYPDKKSAPHKLCTSAVHAAHARQNTSERKPSTFEMKPSTSFGQTTEQSVDVANLEAIKQYQEFEEKVKRTVYLDYFSHQATETVIKTALNQFGTVREIIFLVNYTIPFNIPQSALVVMETEKDAATVVITLNEFPFMMSGMPRPVRAKHATAEMFNDRPRRPGSKSEFRWVGPTDADYHIVKKLKLMSKRHELENLALIKHELEEEHFLAKHQEENLNCNHRKLDAMESVMLSGSFNHLSHFYSVNLDEVF
ncbi:hypothetical protein ABZP36_001318 [Zizania latifolia]